MRRTRRRSLRLRSALFAHGLRFRKHLRIATAGRAVTADIAFQSRRLVVFVDGCFWHSCPSHGVTPRTHSTYWNAKLARNVERDRIVDVELARAGWRVLRLWEYLAPDRALAEVVRALAADDED